MVELQQKHMMPHALSDSSLPSWPSTAKNVQRMLPPPPSSFDPHPPSRQAFTFTGGQLTPPPTNEMSQSTTYRTGFGAGELRFPVRSQNAASQAPSFPYYSKQPSTSLSSIRSPPGLSALVLPDPPERRRSPTSSSSSVAPALQLPQTIHAPQLSLPQLAAEVRNPPSKDFTCRDSRPPQSFSIEP